MEAMPDFMMWQKAEDVLVSPVSRKALRWMDALQGGREYLVFGDDAMAEVALSDIEASGLYVKPL